MNSKDLQDVLTVTGWAMWLRYVKHNNVKMVNNEWPEYDVNGFMNVLDITDETVKEVEQVIIPVIEAEIKQLELPLEDKKIHGPKLGEGNV